jgi:hypothetical protein
MGYSGDGGKLIHAKKNRSKKYRDTVPLKGPLGEKTLLSITSKTIGSYYLKSVEITFFQNCETIFLQTFLQTDKKLLKKLSLEIMFGVVF